MRLLRFALIRIAWLGPTLLLVSVLIFALGQLLPGDAARAMLGNLADPRAVAALRHQLGTDRALSTQYMSWAGGILRGDMGASLAYHAPVAGYLLPALGQSLALAGLALAMLLPIGIGAGVVAALCADTLVDSVIVMAGSSLATVPDFVSSLLLILTLGLGLHWLPVIGTPPPGAGPWAAVTYRILPALPLVFILAGYVARMARSGTLEAVRADYTRTAILKGLPPPVVILRHILPNALAPTIAVLGSQLGYMIGGLVVVESLFQIHGLGNLVYSAAKARDFPMLEAGVLVMAAVYAFGAALGDVLQAALDPRLARPASRP